MKEDNRRGRQEQKKCTASRKQLTKWWEILNYQLIVNGLNILIEKNRVAEWIKDSSILSTRN